MTDSVPWKYLISIRDSGEASLRKNCKQRCFQETWIRGFSAFLWFLSLLQETNSSKRQIQVRDKCIQWRWDTKFIYKYIGAQSCQQAFGLFECPTYRGNKVVSKFVSEFVLYAWAKATSGHSANLSVATIGVQELHTLASSFPLSPSKP